MSIIRKLFGAAPKPTADGAFTPSPLAIKLATSSKTDYDGGKYANPYKNGNLKILMLCTEERNMVMANGVKFSTGNHPVEMALPMLHLLNAGFEIDVFTPTGAPAVIEMWAMPDEDEDVQNLFRDFSTALANPKSLADFVEKDMAEDSPYIGLFIPGGHGAMIGLPTNKDVGKLLNWAHNGDLYTITICHGPGVLLAAHNDNEKFIYDGYKMTVFPDAVDKQTPMIGYLPGHMPWEVEKSLTDLGVTVLNKKADDMCHVDRRLISGASPKAANKLGRLAAQTLLDAVNPK